MRVILGNIWVPRIDPYGISIKHTTADPVSTAQVVIKDDTSSIFVDKMQELLILDDQTVPNPTINLLQNPTLISPTGTKYFTDNTIGATLIGTNPGIQFDINGATGTGQATQYQNVLKGFVVPGQSYMFSAYMNITTGYTNGSTFIGLKFLDNANNVLAANQAFTTNTTPVGSNTRISVQATAPANAASVQALFGVNVTNTSGCLGVVTYTNLQLEPMWFGSQIPYPTPLCEPGQANVTLLANANLYIRQKRKSAGLVNLATWGNYKGNARDITVQAMGYAWLMGGVLTSNNYVNQADRAIILDLLSTYFGTLFTTTNVIQGTSISNLNPNWNDLRSVTDGLAAQIGDFWTVDEYWSTIYEPPGFTTMPISLICDGSGIPDNVTTFPASDFSREMDYTQPGCAVLVIGGTPAATSLTAALTAGNNYTSLSVTALTQAYQNGQVCSLNGLQGITLSADAAVGATTLTIFSFHSNNNYAIGATVTPTQNTALVIDPVTTAANIIPLYGFGTAGNIFMRKVNDSALQSVTDCVQRGIAELLQYAPARNIYHLTTNVELTVGQGIPVTSNTDGLSNTTLLIQQVTTRWLGTDETLKDVWEYQADLGSVNRGTTNILSHIFRNTNSNSTSPSISQTALVAIERIGIQDGPPSSYAQVIFASRAIAYFRLGETAGTSAYDVTGNGGNGGIHGGMTLGVPGAIYLDPNLAMLFDGSSAYISTALTLTSFVSSAFTVCGWIKLSTQTFAQNPRIAADSHTSVDNKGFDMFINANGADGNFYVGTGAANGNAAWSTNFVAGQWYFLAGTWDGSTIKTYVNGVLMNTTAFSGAGTLATGVNTTTALGYNPAYAGDFFPGALDEMVFFQSALSGTTIVNMYNAALRGHS